MTEQGPGVETRSGSGCLGVVARLSWMVLGNIILLFLAVFIFRDGTYSVLDLAFWSVTAAMILIRFIDITRLGGLTKDGEPASLRHWRRYSLFLMLIGGAIWVAAHIL